MNKFKLHQDGIPLEELALPAEFQRSFEERGIGTIEQLLGEMYALKFGDQSPAGKKVYDDYCKHFENHNLTYDHVYAKICAHLSAEKVKKFEEATKNASKYHLGALSHWKDQN
ncbi:MAG: hypothetical protein Q8R37_05315 [Nanoarchaeota archaeon]|nr:hypothetical protein [Nanoarchaeota archaeon]